MGDETRATLEALVDQFLAEAAALLWSGRSDLAGWMFMKAGEIALKCDLDAVEMGLHGGAWDYGLFVDWTDAAKASVRRPRYAAAC